MRRRHKIVNLISEAYFFKPEDFLFRASICLCRFCAALFLPVGRTFQNRTFAVSFRARDFWPKLLRVATSCRAVPQVAALVAFSTATNLDLGFRVLLLIRSAVFRKRVFRFSKLPVFRQNRLRAFSFRIRLREFDVPAELALEFRKTVLRRSFFGELTFFKRLISVARIVDDCFVHLFDSVVVALTKLRQFDVDFLEFLKKNELKYHIF